MKQLVVALIGETGSGKSTFASMCTDEDIHDIIAGKWGKKGTTKQIKRMLYSPDATFDNEYFINTYSNNKDDVLVLPLSKQIQLERFDALLLIDTQGINDWKTDVEKDEVYANALSACNEADIIFVMIPEGGSTVSTNCILEKVFESYCHKPIILINKTAETNTEELGYVKCEEPKTTASQNLKAYANVYAKLGQVIDQITLPDKLSVGVPLLCLLPHSEQLSSDKPTELLKSTNKTLKGSINKVLDYAIRLQTALINTMSIDYSEKHLIEVKNAYRGLYKISVALKNLKCIKGIPMVRPFIYHTSKKMQREYSWQGGTPGEYPVCGGDYTYASNEVYELIKRMISSLNAQVGTKSCLLSILEKISQDYNTPGTFNLPNYSYMRGIPIEWIIDLRTTWYTKYPNQFRVIKDQDFDNNKQYEEWKITPLVFKQNHSDWDKYLNPGCVYTNEVLQSMITNKFGNKANNGHIFLKLVEWCIEKVNFIEQAEDEFRNEYWDNVFDENGILKESSFNDQGTAAIKEEI